MGQSPRSKFEQMRRAAASRPHGTRARYIGGCKCLRCRAASSNYEVQRAAARRAGQWNGIVDAASARQHLLKLRKLGMGRRSVGAASGISDSILAGVLNGSRKQMRAETKRKILACDVSACSDGCRINSGPMWRLLDELLDDGYTKVQLATWLYGRRTKALQFRRGRLVKAHTALRIERLYNLIRQGKYGRP